MKKITNFDVIKNSSPDELAKLLAHITTCQYCPVRECEHLGDSKESPYFYCENKFLEFLESENIVKVGN